MAPDTTEPLDTTPDTTPDTAPDTTSDTVPDTDIGTAPTKQNKFSPIWALSIIPMAGIAVACVILVKKKKKN